MSQPTDPNNDKSFLKKATDSIEDRVDSLDQRMDKFENEVKAKVDRVEQQFSESIDTGVKKTMWFLRRALIVALVAGILTLIGLCIYWNYSYSEGTRSGDLIKISRKGMVFKTYEGQLKLGGIDLQNQDEGLSDTWSFSVTDKDVVQKLEELQGEKVILRYKEIIRAMPWQGDTNYFVTEVKKK